MRDRIDAGAGPDLAADQPKAGAARRIHPDHPMHQQAIDVARTNRTQPPPALRCGGELYLARVINRQDMTAGAGRSSRGVPISDDPLFGHLPVGKEPPRRFLAPPITAKTTQTDRFARNHPGQDRAPLLSRRRSPNCPNVYVMRRLSCLAAIVTITPAPRRASDPTITFRSPQAAREDYLCLSRSAKAGMTIRIA